MSETSPPEERSRRRTRLWDLEGWSLRWKVTAVLAVPVTVAMVLGGLRVQGELSNAVHFTSAAEQISGIPDIVSLEGAMGALVGGHASNTATPEDRELVETQLDRVSDFADTPDLDSNTADAIRKSVAEGRALVDLMDAPGTTIDTLADRQRAFAEGLLTEFDQVVSTVDDPEVVDKGAMLANAWQAQRRLFEETVGLIAILNDPTTPITNVVGATGGEAALLEVLGRYYDERSMEDRSQLDALRAGIDERSRLTAQGVEAIESGTGGLPILQLRTSLLQSKDTYTSLVSDAALDIAATVQNRADETRSAALRDTAIVVGTVLAALVLALLVSRSLVGPIRRLRYGALKAARRDLPDAIEQIKSSDDPRAISFDPVEVYTDEEIGQLARAVDDIHAQALKLAGEQAHLRLQINDMFETLARRSKSLVDQQLTLIESLEFEEKDPRRLESLFRLDHLAARMRRNGENLLVLAGTRSRRAQTDSIALGDILRAAISEVEDYQRVQMGATPEGSLSGAVATDVVHMLAELVDNALRASSPDTSVTFSFARAVDGGVLLEIADRGIGIPADQMFGINERLASGGEIGPETARHMGLFVVSRLAQRHGLTVRMRSTFDTARNPGVTVSIHIPTSLIVSPAERGTGHTGPQRAVQGRQQQAVAAPSRPALPQRRDGGRDAGAPPAPGLPPLPRRGEP
ncbi:ATP-binding protein, partial [Rhodococcus sp. HNM0569]|uniref:sensor histidine kinase n=1 Tax=Rhodococcus sp. HNM0569 TaxID=2716340 RepID=UPI00146BCEFD